MRNLARFNVVVHKCYQVFEDYCNLSIFKKVCACFFQEMVKDSFQMIGLQVFTYWLQFLFPSQFNGQKCQPCLFRNMMGKDSLSPTKGESPAKLVIGLIRFWNCLTARCDYIPDNLSKEKCQNKTLGDYPFTLVPGVHAYFFYLAKVKTFEIITYLSCTVPH